MRKSRIWASQNPPKILPKCLRKRCPNRHGIFLDFCPILDACREGRPLIFAGRAIVLLAFYTIQGFAFYIHFRSEKPTENPFKMRPKPLKNRCRKRAVFQHRFFRVLASILEPLGPSSWSYVGSKSFPKVFPQAPGAFLS